MNAPYLKLNLNSIYIAMDFELKRKSHKQKSLMNSEYKLNIEFSVKIFV